jgi:hypothetical protein
MAVVVAEHFLVGGVSMLLGPELEVGRNQVASATIVAVLIGRLGDLGDPPRRRHSVAQPEYGPTRLVGILGPAVAAQPLGHVWR